MYGTQSVRVEVLIRPTQSTCSLLSFIVIYFLLHRIAWGTVPKFNIDSGKEAERQINIENHFAVERKSVEKNRRKSVKNATKKNVENFLTLSSNIIVN